MYVEFYDNLIMKASQYRVEGGGGGGASLAPSPTKDKRLGPKCVHYLEVPLQQSVCPLPFYELTHPRTAVESLALIDGLSEPHQLLNYVIIKKISCTKH